MDSLGTLLCDKRMPWMTRQSQAWSKRAYSVAALRWPADFCSVFHFTCLKETEMYQFMWWHHLYHHRLLLHSPMSNPSCGIHTVCTPSTNLRADPSLPGNSTYWELITTQHQRLLRSGTGVGYPHPCCKEAHQHPERWCYVHPAALSTGNSQQLFDWSILPKRSTTN